ncbi:hypothetical protein PV708_04645 [Streptomyces sp. ME02-6977A]|uniref:hypothetical protein n=1 Tax=Streptomyces sp. ME02-6977A TaxID=3028671 RepID=UPI0029B3958C|nr:hypothetical protein [Streptomyces sp. ME02-6977A]MDX3405513.1 hypothetical protein [Streptomyces sp. ME02-6977A]
MHRTGRAATAAEALSTLAISPTVAAVLALPDLAGLTADQARGAVCVWGTERLTAESAVDLGEHVGPDGRLFLRACHAHAADRAHRGLLEHAPGCDDCHREPAPGEPIVCGTARSLYRLVKDGRR